MQIRVGEQAMKQSFTVVVERDPVSKWLLGEVVGLPGCCSQAPDEMALEYSVKEAIANYLSMCRPEGPLPDFVGTLQIEVSM